MKKLSLLLLVLSSFSAIHAQENEEISTRKNDVMLSPIELIGGPVLNVSYERLISRTSGFGVNGIFYLIDDESRDYQISPYYRMYFGKKYASGFFVEGFIPITSDSNTYYNYDFNSNGNYIESSRTDNKTTVGFGIGLGAKWHVRNNIVFELSGGVARRIGVDSDLDEVLTGKGMLGIGYRF